MAGDLPPSSGSDSSDDDLAAELEAGMEQAAEEGEMVVGLRRWRGWSRKWRRQRWSAGVRAGAGVAGGTVGAVAVPQ